MIKKLNLIRSIFLCFLVVCVQLPNDLANASSVSEETQEKYVAVLKTYLDNVKEFKFSDNYDLLSKSVKKKLG